MEYSWSTNIFSARFPLASLPSAPPRPRVARSSFTVLSTHWSCAVNRDNTIVNQTPYCCCTPDSRYDVLLRLEILIGISVRGNKLFFHVCANYSSSFSSRRLTIREWDKSRRILSFPVKNFSHLRIDDLSIGSCEDNGTKRRLDRRDHRTSNGQYENTFHSTLITRRKYRNDYTPCPRAYTHGKARTFIIGMGGARRCNLG